MNLRDEAHHSCIHSLGWISRWRFLFRSCLRISSGLFNIWTTCTTPPQPSDVPEGCWSRGGGEGRTGGYRQDRHKQSQLLPRPPAALRGPQEARSAQRRMTNSCLWNWLAWAVKLLRGRGCRRGGENGSRHVNETDRELDGERMRT